MILNKWLENISGSNPDIHKNATLEKVCMELYNNCTFLSPEYCLLSAMGRFFGLRYRIQAKPNTCFNSNDAYARLEKIFGEAKASLIKRVECSLKLMLQAEEHFMNPQCKMTSSQWRALRAKAINFLNG